MAVFPGVPDASDRADLIAYLKTIALIARLSAAPSFRGRSNLNERNPQTDGDEGSRPVIQQLVMCEHDVCDSLSMVAALGLKPRVAGRYGPPF